MTYIGGADIAYLYASIGIITVTPVAVFLCALVQVRKERRKK
ncbi:hypothetical protein [Rarobacter faecitabidus]|uniref:Uncharacterized protein n=1 Tax=Rarobacter faecitabidus TaxID=13243 RepID=A0A542ZT89_RARFA|nr:hypothetical protein [Rarobacter faecitabidus]TQL63551.1 hypothetical protein FB461_0010 [Rarobacter faecitabidus]